MICTVLLAMGSLPLVPVAVTAVVAFSFGLLFKRGLIAKHKKRVLSVENEMLANHTRILSLEKKVSELEAENTALKNRGNSIMPELKVS